MHHDEKLRDKLVTYLEDAYAMEHQIEENLEHQVRATQKFPDIHARIQQHLDATKQHRMRMEERLAAYNKKPSGIKDLLSRMTGNRAGMLSGTRQDSLAMTARDGYVIEHLEIGTYELLIVTAQAFGDTATVQACEANLRDEVQMASWLESQLGQVAILSLQQDGINIPPEELRNAQSAVTSAMHEPTAAEKATRAFADQGALQTGAMTNERPGRAAANDIPTHSDEAATRLSSSRGAQNRPLPPGPDTPVPDAPHYDANTPTWNAGTRSTPENPVPEEPTPGLMDRPGPEAET